MKRLFQLQLLVILGGVAFAWTTVIQDFMKFYGIEGTIFRVQDCVFPNPITTPCFWGAVGFVLALIWAYKIATWTGTKQIQQQRYLMVFLIAGSIFGWSNFALSLSKFIANQGHPTIGCSGQLMTNPFNTPCFYGSVLYLAALVVSIVIVLRSRRQK